MTDIHYYINDFPYYFQNGGNYGSKGIGLHYSKPTRKFGFTKHVDSLICIPLLLYGDGENFYEFFTKQFFGKRVSPCVKLNREESSFIFDRDSLTITNTPLDRYEEGIYISQPYHKFVRTVKFTCGHWRSLIKECGASDFLSAVDATKEYIVREGLSEQWLKEELMKKFVDGQQREAAAARAEAAKKREEEDKKRQEEAAQRTLQEMLK